MANRSSISSSDRLSRGSNTADLSTLSLRRPWSPSLALRVLLDTPGAVIAIPGADALALPGRPVYPDLWDRLRPWTRRWFRAQVLARRMSRRLPVGAIWGFVIILALHGLCARVLYPRPATRVDLRRKIMALTADARPCLLIAGDSRAEQQVMPDTIASAMGLSAPQVANIAISGCEVAAVEAACSELGHRFADRPVMLVSVSVFGVSDHRLLHINSESIWSMSLADRVRLLPARRVVESLFLPEATLYARLREAVRPQPPAFDTAQHGLEAEKQTPVRPGTPEFARQGRHVMEWYKAPDFDGVRWRVLETSLARLQARGCQLVLLDCPMSPALRALMEAESCLDADAAFRAKLADLSRRTHIPLLAYGDDIFEGQDPAGFFWDTVHLNRQGAAILSARIGRDLRTLFEQGDLATTPETPLLIPAPRSSSTADESRDAPTGSR
ncbi:MAG: hypothetical protein GX616_22100 [Planctomycetes bacterium]|nr:hypothetical protein [Planctomycetota bacterium]